MTMQCNRLQSLAMAIVLAAGAGAVWAMAFGFSFGIIGDVIFPNDTTSHVSVLLDGTPVIASYDRSPPYWTYRTLDGKPL